MAVLLDTPPLEAGDRLDRAEFHRRYLATPRIKRAELVEGVVYVPSPLGAAHHGEPHLLAGAWLGVYRAATPGLTVLDSTTLILDDQNELQPDLMARIDAALGGRSRVNAKDYVEGPPELIVEIASSSASYDLHAKRAVYERCGVQEYLVWRTRDGAIDWWTLAGGRYQPLPRDVEGRIASRVLPGLLLETKAMLAGDLARVLEVQQAQHGRPPHLDFVERLAQAR